ncbi:hypothetical protein [Bacillus sp. RO1]|uniref:hypothetical protein n=1 Tax=Bacillus sp. RO1 TaxID=2722703 RepID=UPI001457598F|nr:hypothetical protein [Bacillus sp. RO1]NLP51278.1 hypothetical protein [Bacillus sp. RO1]
MKKVVIYIHEEERKIASKLCDGCGIIKLKEDYPSYKDFYFDNCKECKEGVK